MIGHFNDAVAHLPTGRQGTIVMHPSGSVAISHTPVRFADGQIEELPDAELRVANDEGSLKLTAMRFTSNQPIPAGMTVQLRNNGDHTVTITGQVPGSPAVTVHNLPVKNGEVVLPDALFFPIHG